MSYLVLLSQSAIRLFYNLYRRSVVATLAPITITTNKDFYPVDWDRRLWTGVSEPGLWRGGEAHTIPRGLCGRRTGPRPR